MRHQPFTFLLLATFVTGVCLSVSTGQDIVESDLMIVDSGAAVDQNPAVRPSDSAPVLATATRAPEAPTAEGKEGVPPGVSEAPTSGAQSISTYERTNMAVAKIRDNERAVDPFGLPMDPGGIPDGSMLADQYAEIVEVRETSATSLSSALQQLTLTGAYPADQKIVVGPRSFKRGDEFGMRFGELTLRIRFEGIEERKVYFRDMDTKEMAFLDFNARPQEFEPIYNNSQLSTPDGIDAMNKLFIVN